MMKLDHFAWSCYDLDQGIKQFEKLSGVRAKRGGSHEGLGTRNALIGLGAREYLAIDGPDPGQALVANPGAKLAALTAFELSLFAIETDDIGSCLSTLRAEGYDCRIADHSRVRPDGIHLKSRVIEVAKQRFGVGFPMIMQWETPHHPAIDSPPGCNIVSFEIGHPLDRELASLYRALGLDLIIKPAAAANLKLQLEGMHGEFRL